MDRDIKILTSSYRQTNFKLQNYFPAAALEQCIPNTLNEVFRLRYQFDRLAPYRSPNTALAIFLEERYYK